MSAAELYMQVHSPTTQGYVSPYAASDAEVKAGVVHAEIVRRLNLSEAERELVLIALIDLDVAMRLVPERTRWGIATFLLCPSCREAQKAGREPSKHLCSCGPKRLSADDVSFRFGHAAHVYDVLNAINGTGKYAKTDAARANERQGIVGL